MLFNQNKYAGMGQPDVPLFTQAQCDAAVAAERERCAKLCEAPSNEDLAHGDTGCEWDSLACAAAIRRG